MRIKHSLRVLGYKLFSLKRYMELCYRYVYKRSLNLDNPKAFSEKIYWLKLYYGQYNKQKIQLLYDKFTVREYIKKCIGEKYLNELYGVYSNANDIDFDKLPNKFALKITQSSGKNIICSNKAGLDIEKVKIILNKWLKETNKSKEQEQSYYFTGNAQIICEKFLETKERKVPCDYRFYCFNGEPKYIIYDIDTTLEDGTHGNDIRRNVYNLNWELIDVEFGRPKNVSGKIEKPENLEEMLEISRKLSEEFPFVRVDLYNIDGKIIFGELTWIPMGGNCVITPDSFDYELGELLELPNEKLIYKK